MIATNYENFQELMLIKEMDNYVLLTNEANVEWANKILLKVSKFFQSAKTVSTKFINSIVKFINSLLQKLTPEKKDKFDKYFDKFKNQLTDTLKANLSKDTLKVAVDGALTTAKEKGLIDVKNLKSSFETNKDEIMKLIKQNISSELDKAKEDIISDLEMIDKEVNETFVSKALINIKRFSVGSSFMVVFGLIDNLGLFIGMDAIEDWIMKIGFDAQVAAGIGNTFSDAVGALFGGIIATGLYKLLKVKGEGTTVQQLVGVVIGCMLPVIVKMLIMIL